MGRLYKTVDLGTHDAVIISIGEARIMLSPAWRQNGKVRKNRRKIDLDTPDGTLAKIEVLRVVKGLRSDKQ